MHQSTARRGIVELGEESVKVVGIHHLYIYLVPVEVHIELNCKMQFNYKLFCVELFLSKSVPPFNEFVIVWWVDGSSIYILQDQDRQTAAWVPLIYQSLLNILSKQQGNSRAPLPKKSRGWTVAWQWK